MLGLIVIAAVIALMVFGGIFEQSAQIKAAASEALDKVQSG